MKDRKIYYWEQRNTYCTVQDSLSPWHTFKIVDRTVLLHTALWTLAIRCTAHVVLCTAIAAHIQQAWCIQTGNLVTYRHKKFLPVEIYNTSQLSHVTSKFCTIVKSVNLNTHIRHFCKMHQFTNILQPNTFHIRYFNQRNMVYIRQGPSSSPIQGTGYLGWGFSLFSQALPGKY